MTCCFCQRCAAFGTRLRSCARCGCARRVTGCGDLLVCCVITTRTRLIRIPSDGGTGWFLPGMIFDVMAERGAFISSRIGDFADLALRSLRSILGTRCIVVRNVVRKAMARSYDWCCFSFRTAVALAFSLLRTVPRAGRRLCHKPIAPIMPKGRDLNIGRAGGESMTIHAIVICFITISSATRPSLCIRP